MLRKRQPLKPLADRGPLRTLFALTSMPVGGAETLLVNLIRRLDRQRFAPELCCLKEPGPLGDELAREIPLHSGLLGGKYDLRIFPRLVRLLKQRQIDAVVTVGAGDKMFWGRLAAWRAGVPVIASALHSTGWPDGIGRLNRMLTRWTDAFIGVAKPHGEHLIEQERFPAEKVFVIPNGVDTQKFRGRDNNRTRIREELGIPRQAPVVGIVAALRQEKNHLLFLRSASILHENMADVHFVIVGDGPEREKLEHASRAAKLDSCVHFAGTRGDIAEVLSALDLFALTSHNEANPVSILEAMSVGLPVVSTNVGSVSETVAHGETGYLAKPGAAAEIARYWRDLLSDPATARKMGQAGRQVVVDHWSLEAMVQGYEDLLQSIYERKCPPAAAPPVANISEQPTELVESR